MANNTISDTTETAIMALIFQAQLWTNYAQGTATPLVTPETTISISLNTQANIADTDLMNTTEVAYTGYARQAPLRASSAFTVTGGVVSLVSAITFGASSSAGSTAASFTTGHSGAGAQPVLFGGPISPTIACTSGVTPQLSAITITLD